MATALTLENVQSVYSGKPGCCCGCNGTHKYPSDARGRDKELRGYDIGEDEISDRSVKIIFNKVFGGKLGPAIPNSEREGLTAEQAAEEGEKIFFVETDTRLLIVYFK